MALFKNLTGLCGETFLVILPLALKEEDASNGKKKLIEKKIYTTASLTKAIILL